MGIFQKLRQIDAERNAKHPERQEKWEARKATMAAKKAEQNAKWEQAKQVRSDAKAEKQAAKAANVAARGKELGYVKLTFIGGYDERRRYTGKLYFYENQVEFRTFGEVVKDIVIPASDVGGIEIGGQQQTTSRITATRMLALGVFSLAAPKKTSVKDATVILSLKDGRQVMFHTKTYTEFEVHSKLANAISYYHQLRAKQQLAQLQPSNSISQTDSATLLMKYDTLRKRGVITDE